MADLILWLLCTFGICFSLCFRMPGMIKSRLPKFFEDMFSCIFCTGFWSGIFGALICYPFPSGLGFIKLLAFAFAGASICYITDTVMVRIEKGGKDG